MLLLLAALPFLRVVPDLPDLAAPPDIVDGSGTLLLYRPWLSSSCRRRRKYAAILFLRGGGGTLRLGLGFRCFLAAVCPGACPSIADSTGQGGRLHPGFLRMRCWMW